MFASFADICLILTASNDPIFLNTYSIGRNRALYGEIPDGAGSLSWSISIGIPSSHIVFPAGNADTRILIVPSTADNNTSNFGWNVAKTQKVNGKIKKLWSVTIVRQQASNFKSLPDAIRVAGRHPGTLLRFLFGNEERLFYRQNEKAPGVSDFVSTMSASKGFALYRFGYIQGGEPFECSFLEASGQQIEVDEYGHRYQFPNWSGTTSVESDIGYDYPITFQECYYLKTIGYRLPVDVEQRLARAPKVSR